MKLDLLRVFDLGLQSSSDPVMEELGLTVAEEWVSPESKAARGAPWLAVCEGIQVV